MTQLEICANGYKSAYLASQFGADRIELCQKLSVGGLSPHPKLIAAVSGTLDIPVHVLVRPRKGDFCYSETEIDAMIGTIRFCQKLGCEGVVTGALTTDGTIDRVAMKQLQEAAGGMEFTFHRAFDVCKNPLNMLDQLIELGVTRVLSSGQRQTAVEGLPLLQLMLEQANGKIQIMPGGGITSKNAMVFKETGFLMLHTSATRKSETAASNQDLFSSTTTGNSDPEEIVRLKQLLA